MCTCGHARAEHDDVRIGVGPFRYEQWCSGCSCIDFEAQSAPSEPTAAAFESGGKR